MGQICCWMFKWIWALRLPMLPSFLRRRYGLWDPVGYLQIADRAKEARQGEIGPPYVANITFVDDDINIGHIGGILQWVVAEHGQLAFAADVKFDEFSVFLGVDPVGERDTKFELKMRGWIWGHMMSLDLPETST